MTLNRLPITGKPTKPAEPLRKIALEEHFMHNEAVNPGGKLDLEAFARVSGLGLDYLRVVMQRMSDLHEKRIEEMDAAGIDISILSLTAAGIEGIADRDHAVDAAARVNDYLAGEIDKSNGRYLGFASVALQDPDIAARELERAIKELHFKGVMINGYVQTDDPNVGLYLDDARFAPFWAAAAELGIPVYLHPRPSLQPVRDALYSGAEYLANATWGFTSETATHALRLVYSGLFDRHKDLQLILGHMGETIPFFSWRIQNKFEHAPLGRSVEKRLQDYLSDNIHITTSGNNHDQGLICAILTVGADRIMFSADYPFEMQDEAGRWIESAPISEGDRRKIAHGNAKRLFNI